MSAGLSDTDAEVQDTQQSPDSRVSALPRSTGVVDVGELLGIIDELLDVWSTQIEHLSEDLQREGLHKSVPIIVHGLTAHVADLARATALLYRADVTVAAIPLIRAMIEDVATIDYVLENDEGWKDVQDASFKQRRLILNDFEATGEVQPWFEKARSHLEWMRENGAKDPRPIKARFEDAEPGRVSMYTQYRNLSDEIHAGMGVVTKYTEADPEQPGSYGLASTANDGSAPVKLVNAVMSLQSALMSWQTLWGSVATATRLTEIDEYPLVRFVEEQ